MKLTNFALIGLVAVALLNVVAIAPATILVQENFAGLTVSTNLTGQDGWLTSFDRSAEVGTGTGVNTSTIVVAPSNATSPSPNNAGNRQVVGNFGLTTSSNVALHFDGRVSGTTNPHTTTFGIGNNASNVTGPNFGVLGGIFGMRADNLGTTSLAKTAAGANFQPVVNTWYRFASQWDLSTSTATLWAKDLSGTDPNISNTTFTQLFFNNTRSVSKATLGTLSNLSNWSEARLRSGGDSSGAAGSGDIDNILAQTTVVLADYRFGTSVFDQTSSDTEPYSVAGSITAGAGTTMGDSALGIPARSAFFTGTSLASATEALAVTNNDYVTFTISPGNAPTYSLTTLSFDVQRDDAGSPLNYSLFADENPGAGGNNFVTLLATGAMSTDVGLSDATKFFNYSAYLGDTAFLQDLSTATTLRLYFWGGTGVTGTNIRLDNVVLQGTVTPEPAALGLAAVGLVGLVLVGLRARQNLRKKVLSTQY